jgi:two-component system sensor kinase FixL
VRIAAERAEEGGALVTVCDDGPGIPSDVLPVLFDAFATARIEGTGLGLSTTKRIVEAHGGTISASNRPEGGARFEIRLPG